MEPELCWVVLTPDVVARGLVGSILTRFECAGYQIDGMQQREKTESWALQHYGVSLIEPEFLACLLSGAVTGFGVAGPQACQRVAAMVGGFCLAGSIRGDFCLAPEFPLLSTSKDGKDGLRQAGLFYSIEGDKPPA